MIASCNLAVFGWPSFYGDGRPVMPCVGFIESDYARGTYYSCVTCNPNWSRVAAPNAASGSHPQPEGG
jgi:hypothetical protein